MLGYIYRITNKVTQQHYIGQTIDINRRKRKHFNTLKNNTHDNPKLQASWNKYGEENFEFEYWKFEINSEEELNQLECEYIDKYDSLANGFNLVPGGGKPPSRQKINNDDIVTFLCVQDKLGDGYGKTCEEIFGWSRGTASAAKRRKRYLNAIAQFDSLTKDEKTQIADDFIQSQELYKVALNRQLKQGGCQKAYQLTEDDYFFAFTAQELGYTYTSVANYLGIKPSTVKDWFNGRARAKEKAKYMALSEEQKILLVGRVETAELSGNPKSDSSN